MESSRPWPWPRGSSRPANGVLGLEAPVLGLDLEAVVLGLEGQVLGLGLACGGLDSKSVIEHSISFTGLDIIKHM